MIKDFLRYILRIFLANKDYDNEHYLEASQYFIFLIVLKCF